jgi:hypothetical protein
MAMVDFDEYLNVGTTEWNMPMFDVDTALSVGLRMVGAISLC